MAYFCRSVILIVSNWFDMFVAITQHLLSTRQPGTSGLSFSGMLPIGEQREDGGNGINSVADLLSVISSTMESHLPNPLSRQPGSGSLGKKIDSLKGRGLRSDPARGRPQSR